MVFKVKQRSQANYYDFKASDRGAPRKEITEDLTLKEKYMQYNWPYDFFSFVEMIKIDTEVLYNHEGDTAYLEAYGGSVGTPPVESTTIPGTAPPGTATATASPVTTVPGTTTGTAVEGAASAMPPTGVVPTIPGGSSY